MLNLANVALFCVEKIMFENHYSLFKPFRISNKVLTGELRVRENF